MEIKNTHQATPGAKKGHKFIYCICN